MSVIYEYKNHLEIANEWSFCRRNKELAFKPFQFTLSWLYWTDLLTPQLEQANFVMRSTATFGPLAYLPGKAVKLAERIFQLFNHEFSARGAAIVAGRSLQFGSSCVGALKLADCYGVIDLSKDQSAFISPIATWGLAASIGFTTKRVIKAFSRLANNRLSEPGVSKFIFHYEIHRFTADLIRLISIVTKLTTQVLAFLAIAFGVFAPPIILIFATLSFLTEITHHFYAKMHQPTTQKTLHI